MEREETETDRPVCQKKKTISVLEINDLADSVPSCLAERRVREREKDLCLEKND